jgi:hypothetical protein
MGCCGMRPSESDSIDELAFYEDEQYEKKRQEEIKFYKNYMLHFSLNNYVFEVEELKNF